MKKNFSYLLDRTDMAIIKEGLDAIEESLQEEMEDYKDMADCNQDDEWVKAQKDEADYRWGEYQDLYYNLMDVLQSMGEGDIAEITIKVKKNS